MQSEDLDIKKAASEIKKILEKYNCGGFISLVTERKGEFFLHLPQWSSMQFEKDESGYARLRFKSKKEELSRMASTVHMIQCFLKTTRSTSNMMDSILEKLESVMFITGEPIREDNIL
jgi:hypothetical protein